MEVTKEEKERAVPQKTLGAWKMALKHGDKTAIAAIYGYKRQEVITAFRGLATPSLIGAINEFYGIEG